MTALLLALSLALPNPSTTAHQADQRRTSLTGTIEKIEGFKSASLGNTRNLIVYLPPDYAKNPKQHYSVVYMHDGQNVFDGQTSYIPNEEWRADEAAQALITANLIEPIIIVGIDNGGTERANEYLPMKVKMGSNSGGGKADPYGKMLIEEIMPLINKRYRTKTGPTHTGLIGSSFGGVITFYLGMTHPEVFGRLGVVSPSTWVNDSNLGNYVKPTKDRPRIWLDMGTKEGPKSVTEVGNLYNAILKNGWKPKRDVTLYVDGFAGHNERAWASRIGMILTYLFPQK